MFSSPTGELSFYQLMVCLISLQRRFSSPTGELSFYLMFISSLIRFQALVFVPYRGTKFLSREMLKSG